MTSAAVAASKLWLEQAASDARAAEALLAGPAPMSSRDIGCHVAALCAQAIEESLEGYAFLNGATPGVGAKLLGKKAVRIVGSSEETTCYVSPEYFAEDGPFADFIVHEAAHIFHNCKRRTLGLRETRADVDALDELRFCDFLRDTYGQKLPSRAADRLRLLGNMNLATDDGVLNLAGLLLFAEQPHRFKLQFVVKAVKYPSTDIHTSKYDDTEDFSGPFRRVFDDAIAFVLRNLRKVQAGRGVNSPGTPEIPPVVFEELLVNALVHRDYLISAPIRVFIFDDRIEIISPGTLPNDLTVENIRAGNSNLRNPILASFVAKGVLPYRGLGSGVPRALEAWPDIEFRDDRDGGLFVATVKRKALAPGEASGEHAQKTTQKATQKTPQKLLDLIAQDPSVTRPSLAEALGITSDGVTYHLRKLQEGGAPSSRRSRQGWALGGDHAQRTAEAMSQPDAMPETAPRDGGRGGADARRAALDELLRRTRHRLRAPRAAPVHPRRRRVGAAVLPRRVPALREHLQRAAPCARPTPPR